MRSPGFDVGPKFNARYPYKRRAEGDQRHRDPGTHGEGQEISFALSSKGTHGAPPEAGSGQEALSWSL